MKQKPSSTAKIGGETFTFTEGEQKTPLLEKTAPGNSGAKKPSHKATTSAPATTTGHSSAPAKNSKSGTAPKKKPPRKTGEDLTHAKDTTEPITAPTSTKTSTKANKPETEPTQPNVPFDEESDLIKLSEEAPLHRRTLSNKASQIFNSLPPITSRQKLADSIIAGNVDAVKAIKTEDWGLHKPFTLMTDNPCNGLTPYQAAAKFLKPEIIRVFAKNGGTTSIGSVAQATGKTAFGFALQHLNNSTSQQAAEDTLYTLLYNGLKPPQKETNDFTTFYTSKIRDKTASDKLNAIAYYLNISVSNDLAVSRGSSAEAVIGTPSPGGFPGDTSINKEALISRLNKLNTFVTDSREELLAKKAEDGKQNHRPAPAPTKSIKTKSDDKTFGEKMKRNMGFGAAGLGLTFAGIFAILLLPGIREAFFATVAIAASNLLTLVAALAIVAVVAIVVVAAVTAISHGAGSLKNNIDEKKQAKAEKKEIAIPEPQIDVMLDAAIRKCDSQLREIDDVRGDLNSEKANLGEIKSEIDNLSKKIAGQDTFTTALDAERSSARLASRAA